MSTSFRCDGDPDCLDASDELNCRKSKIVAMSVFLEIFRMLIYAEIPMAECPDGEFKCKSSASGITGPGNLCILMKYRCDGDNDCGDWSDEEGCQTMKSVSCSANEFKCDDGTCIPLRWKCDMEQDCDGGEDEKSCTSTDHAAKHQCVDDEFQCKDGRCILVCVFSIHIIDI